MRTIKIALLVMVLICGLCAFEQKADAHTSVFLGFSTYQPAYFHSFYPAWYGYGWPYYGYGFYRPYYYGFYRPYYYGGYGYGGYGPYYQPYGRYYGYGEIRLEVKPKTAKVYVDGGYVGVVDDYDGWWQRLKLEPGSHRIVIREPGYRPYAETVRVLPGEDTHIKLRMQPGQDQIPENEMRLGRNDNDRYRNYDHRGYSDRYRPRPRSDDSDRYRNEDRERDRNYGDQNDRDNSYQDRGADRERGKDQQTFVLQVEPHDATVYIDGNYYGTADANQSGEVQVLLPKGTHKVEVVRPGYQPFSQEITVDGHQDNRLLVQLHRK